MGRSSDNRSNTLQTCTYFAVCFFLFFMSLFFCRLAFKANNDPDFESPYFSFELIWHLMVITAAGLIILQALRIVLCRKSDKELRRLMVIRLLLRIENIFCAAGITFSLLFPFLPLSNLNVYDGFGWIGTDICGIMIAAVLSRMIGMIDNNTIKSVMTEPHSKTENHY